MSENLAQMSQIMQIPEVQAAIKMRNANKIGAELEAELGRVEWDWVKFIFLALRFRKSYEEDRY